MTTLLPGVAFHGQQDTSTKSRKRPRITISPEQAPLNEEIYYIGSSDDDSVETRSCKRTKRERFAEDYLKYGYVPILTARLKGPFGHGWRNPWAKTSTQTPTVEESPVARRVSSYVDRSSPTPRARKKRITPGTRTKSPPRGLSLLLKELSDAQSHSNKLNSELLDASTNSPANQTRHKVRSYPAHIDITIESPVLGDNTSTKRTGRKHLSNPSDPYKYRSPKLHKPETYGKNFNVLSIVDNIETARADNGQKLEEAKQIKEAQHRGESDQPGDSNQPSITKHGVVSRSSSRSMSLGGNVTKPPQEEDYEGDDFNHKVALSKTGLQIEGAENLDRRKQNNANASMPSVVYEANLAHGAGATNNLPDGSKGRIHQGRTSRKSVVQNEGSHSSHLAKPKGQSELLQACSKYLGIKHSDSTIFMIEKEEDYPDEPGFIAGIFPDFDYTPSKNKTGRKSKMSWHFESRESGGHKIFYEGRPIIQDDGGVEEFDYQTLNDILSTLRGATDMTRQHGYTMNSGGSPAKQFKRAEIALQLTENFAKIAEVLDLHKCLEDELHDGEPQLETCAKLILAQPSTRRMVVSKNSTLEAFMRNKLSLGAEFTARRVTEQAGVVRSPNGQAHDDASNDGDIEMTEISDKVGEETTFEKMGDMQNFAVIRAEGEGSFKPRPERLKGSKKLRQHNKKAKPEDHSIKAYLSELKANESQNSLWDQGDGASRNGVQEELDDIYTVQWTEDRDSCSSENEEETKNPVDGHQDHFIPPSSTGIDLGAHSEEDVSDHEGRTEKDPATLSHCEKLEHHDTLGNVEQMVKDIPGASSTGTAPKITSNEAPQGPARTTDVDQIAVERQIEAEISEPLKRNTQSSKEDQESPRRQTICPGGELIITGSDPKIEMVNGESRVISINDDSSDSSVNQLEDEEKDSVVEEVSNLLKGGRNGIATNEDQSPDAIPGKGQAPETREAIFSKFLDEVHKLVIKKVSQSSVPLKLISQTSTWSDDHPVRSALAVKSCGEDLNACRQLSNGIQQSNGPTGNPHGTSLDNLAGDFAEQPVTELPPLRWTTTTEDEQSSNDKRQSNKTPSNQQSGKAVSFPGTDNNLVSDRPGPYQVDTSHYLKSSSQPLNKNMSANSSQHKSILSASASQPVNASQISGTGQASLSHSLRISRASEISNLKADSLRMDVQSPALLITDQEERAALEDAQAFLGTWSSERDVFLKSA